MKLRLSHILSGAMMATCLVAYAAPLSPDQAQQRASRAMGASGLRMASPAASLALAYTDDSEALPAYYVFNSTQGGFVIAGADDLAAPVLGYVDHGSFCADSMPENMRWWLGQYAAEIAAARKAPRPETLSPRSTPQRPAIIPMVRTRWNQDNPYNYYCPKVGSRPTYTGCGATAVAQAMKYFNYPERGQGTVSYSWNGQNLTKNLRRIVFDWDNMLPDYGSARYTDVQRDAVANLMMGVGYAMNMNYGTNASASSTTAPAYALVTWMGYAPSTAHYNRDWFSYDEWEEMVYASLADGSPVPYTGQGDGGGHAFVVDGYDGRGYFHVNWGWGGSSDGYFLLTGLDPSTLGIGGGSGGFNSMQSAVIGMKPPYPGAKPKPVFATTDNASVEWDNGRLNFKGGMFSFTPSTIDASFGFELEDEHGNVTYSQPGPKVGFQYIHGFNGYTATYDSVAPPAGVYKVRPAAYYYPADGEPFWVRSYIPRTNPQYWILKSDGSQVSMSGLDCSQPVTVSDLAPATRIMPDRYFRLKARISNPNPVAINKLVYPCFLYSNGQVDEPLSPILIEIPASGTLDFIWEGEATYVDEGEYLLGLCEKNSAGQFVALGTPVTVNVESDSQDFELSMEQCWVDDSQNVNPANVPLRMKIKCGKGFYSDYLMINVMENETYSRLNLRTPICYFSQGETKEVDFDFAFMSAEAQKTYGIRVFYVRNGRSVRLGSCDFYATVSNVGEITADDAWSISPNPACEDVEVTAPSEIQNIEVFSLQGACCAVTPAIDGCRAAIHVSSLPTGIYLVNVTTLSGHKTLRLIRK